MNNFPSIDPADNDSLVGTIKFAVQKMLQDHDDMLPATVIAVEAGPPTFVQVQPQIVMVGTSGEQVSRAQLAKLPVLTLGGGGFLLSFPIKTGDFGWIKANDRDISIFMQSLKESEPGTIRQHSFSDAIFIPQVFSGYSFDSENMVLQNLSGSVKIVLGDDQIDITAPTVNIDGADEVNIDSGTVINITAPDTIINGDLLVNGNIGATGSITPGV